MPGKSKKHGWKIFLALLLILALAGGGAWYKFYYKKETPIIVQAEKIARRNITELVVANGRIQPVLQVVINPEVSGEIIELPVKEGQFVRKGDVLVCIKQDNYLAQRKSAEASYLGSSASQSMAEANLRKTEFEFKRIKELFDKQLVSEAQYTDAQAAFDVAKASFQSSTHQVAQTKAMLARADDDLAKTTISAPMDGTVTRLRSQKGERVVGTALMAGTEIMTIANLEAMEARVDVGEVDVILIALGQKAHIEVDAFKDRKFSGVVTEIANAAKGGAGAFASASQEATKFEIKIRVEEKEAFRPGMSVTAEIETRSRTNVLAVPIQSVTARPPKKPEAQTNAVQKAASTNAPASSSPMTNAPKSGDAKKASEANKTIEIVWIVESETVKMTPVKRGISDDNYVEITEGVTEGQEVVTGGYRAINRDLADEKKIKIGQPVEETEAEKGRKP